MIITMLLSIIKYLKKNNSFNFYGVPLIHPGQEEGKWSY